MGRIRGLDQATIKARSRELLERLGFLPDPHAPIDSLSKGNKQKVVIAQAFLGPVGLVVLDEPYSGLDVRAQWSLGELIESERARGAAILMTSHTLSSGSDQDRVYRIDDGYLYPIQSTVVGSALRRIELTATEHSCAAQVLSAVSLHRADHDPSRRTLSLVVAASEADALLHDAIHNGWSVTGVTPLRNGGT